MTWKNVMRGVAVGDAWGADNEFQKIDTLIVNDPMGPDLPESLRITDDTQMTLYLAAALDDSWGASMPEVKAAILDAYLTYYDDPDNNRAPGITVMGSLGKLARGQSWQEATSPTSDGSGTVMRTSPTAFLPADRWVGVTAFAAAVTHGSANGIAAAILNAAVLRELLRGEVKPGGLLHTALQMASFPEAEGLLNIGEWLDGYEVDLALGFAELVRLINIALDKLPFLQLDPWARNSDPSLHVGGGGWRSHETLVIALLAVDMIPDDHWLALRRSATSDGDSDTIGAVTGALLGASGVVWPDVFDRLEPRYQRWIENEADFYQFAGRRSWFKRMVGRP